MVRAERPETPPRRSTAPRGWRAWSLEAATVDTAGVVHLLLGLDDVAAAEWPAGARLRYRVEIGPALRLALEVENRGPAPFVFEEALHTYLAVEDVERISVTGLEGAAFLDETDGFARKREGAAPLVVRGETDRIYDETRATCVVRDPVARRRLEIVKTGSEATVVWNPGAARALPDLGADEWPRFLCVESGNVGARRRHRGSRRAPPADRQHPQRALARRLRRGFLPGVSPSGILLQVGTRSRAGAGRSTPPRHPGRARVAELADALDLGSSGRNPLGVQLPPLAPHLA